MSHDLSAIEDALDDYRPPDDAIEAALEGVSGAARVERARAIAGLLGERDEPGRAWLMYARAVMMARSLPPSTETASAILECHLGRATLAAGADEEDGIGGEAEALAEALRDAARLIGACPSDEVRAPLVLLHARAGAIGAPGEHFAAVARHAEDIARPTRAILEAWSRAELGLAEGGGDVERLTRRVIARESAEPGPTPEHLAALCLLSTVVADPAPVIREGIALARIRDTREVDPAMRAFLFGPTAPHPFDLSWLAPNWMLQAGSHGTPRPDDLGDEMVFGPRRDLACACGAYEGFASYGVICEKCGVEVLTSVVRRSRFGHLPLPAPVLHPRARRIAALLLDRAEGEIVGASREELQGVDLEALKEDLAALRSRGVVYGGIHRIADRASTLDAVRALPTRTDALFFEVLPVPPPHLVDAPLERAYRAVREASEENIALAVDAVFALTWPAPAGPFD